MPFQFTVGGKTLLAGDYTITSTAAGRSRSRMPTNASPPRVSLIAAISDGSKLVFEKYGSQYFLHDVMCPANFTLNVHMPKSGRERREETAAAKHGDGGEKS